MSSPQPGKPDAQLVAEARQGAREVFAELVSRHWDTAVSLAARVLGSAELAGDAASLVQAAGSHLFNLALVTGAPIRIDSRLLDAEYPVAAAKKPAPFRVATAQMAAEARQRIEQVLSTGRASQAAGGAEPAPGH